MIHVFKLGGDWTDKKGNTYDVKSVNKLAEAKEGYYPSLELAIANKPKPKKKAAKPAIEETKDLLE